MTAIHALSRAVRQFTAPFGATGRQIRAPGTRRSAATHFDGIRFHNTQAATPLPPGAVLSTLRAFAARDRQRHPAFGVPVERPQLPERAGGLAATWMGHATVLLEVDGHRILADPIFADRASPAAWVGPRRLHAPPLALGDLPPLDAIIISHDHYDHLDHTTVLALAAGSAAPFLVPLGVGAHLRSWGVPPERIVELDWGQAHHRGTLRITCTPARHFSGRGLTRNHTLWCSWSIAGPTRRVFFGGDTGYAPVFADISSDHGPFDLTALPIGAYADSWPDIHMTPEQALQAHRDLGGSILLPIHWATFDLAPHPWSDPIERLLATAGDAIVTVPPPGKRIDIDRPVEREPWWRQR